MTQPTDPASPPTVPAPAPTAAPPTATVNEQPAPATVSSDQPAPAPTGPTFDVGQFAVLTSGQGDYTQTELVIVTSDQGEADLPNEDGTVEHYYTVARVPQGHAVPASRLAPA